MIDQVDDALVVTRGKPRFRTLAAHIAIQSLTAINLGRLVVCALGFPLGFAFAFSFSHAVGRLLVLGLAFARAIIRRHGADHVIALALEELGSLAIVLFAALLRGHEAIVFAWHHANGSQGSIGALVDGRRSACAHEVGDNSRGINTAMPLGLAQRTAFAKFDLDIADNGCVRLRATGIVCTVAGSAVGNFSQLLVHETKDNLKSGKKQGLTS